MTAENGTAAAEQRIEEIVRELKLEKHPEGGWFAEVYTAPISFAEGSGQRISLPFMRSIVMSFGIIMKAPACGCMF